MGTDARSPMTTTCQLHVSIRANANNPGRFLLLEVDSGSHSERTDGFPIRHLPGVVFFAD
jgi:hypothetical protein